MRQSAGLLLYRVRDGRLECLLVHPGGPLWARRDTGAWSLPKGEIERDETPRAVAGREFREETGSEPPDPARWLDLGEVRLRSGKIVCAWAVEGDLDPSLAVSEPFEREWPPRSGQRASFPEVDRVEWFGPAEARRRLNPAQTPFVDRLLERLGAEVEVLLSDFDARECAGEHLVLTPLSLNGLKVLRLLQRGTFAEVARVRLSPALAGEVEECLAQHIRYVLEREVRSARFVQDIRRLG